MMRIDSILKTACCGLFLIIIYGSGVIVFAQDKVENKSEGKMKNRPFCSNSSYSSSDRVHFSDLREMTIPAGALTVDGGRNGGVQVRGENRNDILIRACVQAWGTSEENAKTLAGSVKIATSPVVKAESSSEESNWGVSYEILVPSSTDLKLTTHNGGISITSVDGRLEFEAMNGGLALNDVSGDVRGRTTNGGIAVNLAGNSWNGAGLNVETTNGGVSLMMPETYAAHFETRTVNGGFVSNINSLQAFQAERKEKGRQGINLNTELNGGGAPIRVVTTNGGVVVNTRKYK